MKVPSSLQSGELGFNMTPMIDVVFLLIIFFLVSSHLARQESQMELDLPEVKLTDPESEANAKRVTINVTPDGGIVFNGRKIAAAQLEGRLEQRKADLGEDMEVRLRSDRNAEYRHIQPVLLACVRSGISNLKVGAFQGVAQ